MRNMLLIFCSIISTSVFGSDFKGNVLLKFPREEVNMENGEREISEPKIEIPRTLDYWSPPNFSIGKWKCEFTRNDFIGTKSTIMVRCYIGNKFSTEGNSIGILTMYSCGRDSEQHVINLWTEGVDRHIFIYCDGW